MSLPIIRRDDGADFERRLIGGADDTAVAHDSDDVCKPHHFIEPMRDVEDGRARGAHAAQQRVKVLDLARAERGRRLIKNKDAGVRRDALGDLDELLLRFGQVADAGIRRNFDAEVARAPASPSAQRAPIDSNARLASARAECSRPPSDRYQRELLKDGGNAQ